MTKLLDAVAVIEKNTREDVRVTLDEFHGVQVVDVRIYADFKTGTIGAIRSPTKKGISLKVEKLDALIYGLGKARDEAARRGLLPTD